MEHQTPGVYIGFFSNEVFNDMEFVDKALGAPPDENFVDWVTQEFVKFDQDIAIKTFNFVNHDTMLSETVIQCEFSDTVAEMQFQLAADCKFQKFFTRQNSGSGSPWRN